MDGFFFDFAEGEENEYFEDDSKANDNLVSSNNQEYERQLEFEEEDYKDGIDRIPIHQTIAVVGAMLETETPLQAEITEEVTEYISLTEARGPKQVCKYKKPLRPFEQYVQDVLSGKKDRRDPL